MWRRTWWLTIGLLGVANVAAAAPTSPSTAPRSPRTTMPSPARTSSRPATPVASHPLAMSTSLATSTSPRAAGAKPRTVGSSRLYAPKQANESDEAFFTRAASELTRTAATGSSGELTSHGHAALERLARGAGHNAIRNVVTSGGVVGSVSGNDYPTFYREGWNSANLNRPAAAATTSGPAKSAGPAGEPNHALEHDLRALLSKSESGRQALAHLERTGASIRFRSGGGTSNDAANKALVIDTKMADGSQKPVSWLAVSTVHEVSHAWDDHTKQTPSTVSPIGDTYAEATRTGQVTPELDHRVERVRQNYVTRQIAGEARAMTAEVRARRELEAGGTDFVKLNGKLLEAYNRGYEGVYHSAGMKPPATSHAAADLGGDP